MNTTKTTDLSQFILARRSVTIGSGYEGTEIDMPFGVLLVVQGRPSAFLPKKGKTMVDGVFHGVKYGTTRGVGAMWLHAKGKTAKRIQRVCALEVLAQAAKGGWSSLFDAARADGTFDALKAELDAVMEAVCSAKEDSRQPALI